MAGRLVRNISDCLQTVADFLIEVEKGNILGIIVQNLEIWKKFCVIVRQLVRICVLMTSTRGGPPFTEMQPRTL